jgi:hypothetical protein
VLDPEPKKYTLEPKADWLRPHFEGKQFDFGKTYEVMGFKFTIQLDDYPKTDSKDIIFHINSLDGLVGEYKDKLTAETDAKEASIIILSTVGRSPSKERTFLNKLMEKFIEQDLEEKNQATALTSRFIDNLLATNVDTLNRNKSEMTTMRTITGTNNINIKYAELRSQIRELEDRREALQLSISFASQLLDQLRRNADVSQIAIPRAWAWKPPVEREPHRIAKAAGNHCGPASQKPAPRGDRGSHPRTGSGRPQQHCGAPRRDQHAVKPGKRPDCQQ